MSTMIEVSDVVGLEMYLDDEVADLVVRNPAGEVRVRLTWDDWWRVHLLLMHQMSKSAGIEEYVMDDGDSWYRFEPLEIAQHPDPRLWGGWQGRKKST